MAKSRAKKKAKKAKKVDPNIISTGGFLSPSGSPKQQKIAELATELGEAYKTKVSVRQVQLVQAATRRVGGRVENQGLKDKAES